jgi:hypothetical protein
MSKRYDKSSGQFYSGVFVGSVLVFIVVVLLYPGWFNRFRMSGHEIIHTGSLMLALLSTTFWGEYGYYGRPYKRTCIMNDGKSKYVTQWIWMNILYWIGFIIYLFTFDIKSPFWSMFCLGLCIILYCINCSEYKKYNKTGKE